MFRETQRLRLTSTCPIDRAIGGRIRAERWRRGWSLEHLARIAGMTAMRLRFVEWGWARMSAVDMMQVLKSLDRQPAWLFQDVEFE